MQEFIRFLGYNCHLFDGIIGPLPKWNDIARRDCIANQIDGAGFAVVGLQEVWSDASKALIISRCRRSLPHAFTDSRFGRMGSGLLLLSRYPLIDPRFVPFSASAGIDRMAQKGIVQAVVASPSGRFRVFLTHAQADDRVAELAHELRHGVKRIVKHFAQRSTLAYARSRAVRAMNLHQLREQIHSYYSELPAVVIGDLNVPDISSEYDVMMRQIFVGLWDSYLHLHPEKTGVTYDPNNPLVQKWDRGARTPMRLDYILCSADGAWRIKESAPLGLKMPSGEDVSDHYGMSASLVLEPGRTLDG